MKILLNAFRFQPQTGAWDSNKEKQHAMEVNGSAGSGFIFYRCGVIGTCTGDVFG
jgi:hypothetical protein